MFSLSFVMLNKWVLSQYKLKQTNGMENTATTRSYTPCSPLYLYNKLFLRVYAGKARTPLPGPNFAITPPSRGSCRSLINPGFSKASPADQYFGSAGLTEKTWKWKTLKSSITTSPLVPSKEVRPWNMKLSEKTKHQPRLVTAKKIISRQNTTYFDK